MAYRTRLFTERTSNVSGMESIRLLRKDLVSWWTKDMYDSGIEAVPLGRRTFYHFARPEFMQHVLLEKSDHFVVSHIAKIMLGLAMGEGLLTSDKEQWRAQRRMAAPLFRKLTMDQYLPVMDQSALKSVMLLKGKLGQEQIMLPVMTATTLDVILDSIFGGIDVDRPMVAREVENYLKVMAVVGITDTLQIPRWILRPWRWRGYLAVWRLRRLVNQMLSSHRHNGANEEGLLSRMLAMKDPETGEGMPRRLIVDNIMTFVGAGHETTSVGLSWALYLLAEQPELQEKIAAEVSSVVSDEPLTMEAIEKLDLTRRFFMETMRLYPPVAAMVRSVETDVTISGIDLKKDDHVTLATLPMHRNPLYWPDPDAFDPDRFLPEEIKKRPRFSYLPFGGGPRICIGMEFTMLEAVTILARLVKAYRFLPTGKNPHPLVSVTTRPDNGVPLIVERR
ncbi:MAG: cytochrome P450 [Hyphomicrobiales bacterium]